MKKDIPMPIIITVIVVILVIVGVIYFFKTQPTGTQTDANGLPIGERHDPPAGWSLDGSGQTAAPVQGTNNP